MKPFLTFLLLGLTLPSLVYGQGVRLPYKGQAGELPLEVALRFVKHRLGHQGQFHYKTLKITQTSQPEAFDQAEITFVQDGQKNSHTKATRQRLQLSRQQTVWIIHSLTEDFNCRKGEKGWSQRPCS